MSGVPLFNLAPNLTVSRLCLGSMSFGEQNTLAESFQLMDQAFHAGINFFDSAEMYPVPQRAHTCGRSEECLGRWISQRKIPRDSLVIATKVLFFCLVAIYVALSLLFSSSCSYCKPRLLDLLGR